MPPFHELKLSNKLYADALRAAASRGFTSIEEYLASAVGQDLMDEETPGWMLEELDKGVEALNQGKVLSWDEAQASFLRRRADYLADRS